MAANRHRLQLEHTAVFRDYLTSFHREYSIHSTSTTSQFMQGIWECPVFWYDYYDIEYKISDEVLAKNEFNIVSSSHQTKIDAVNLLICGSEASDDDVWCLWKI
jgi:hypothetical protein